MERLETEVNACKRYTQNWVKKAKKCADRLHDEFWKVLDGKLTEEEFKIFCEAETLSQEKNKVYIELNMEINKQLSI